jgi:hypothetical protein
MPDNEDTNTQTKTRRLATWAAGIITAGSLLVGINTFTGLNFRPAWGYEIEQVKGDNTKTNALFLAANTKIETRLERVLQIQNTTSRTMEALKKGQLELRIHQIDRQIRELNRELAGQQTRAQDEYRSKGHMVPSWLSNAISNSGSTIAVLNNERNRVESQILELSQ